MKAMIPFLFVFFFIPSLFASETFSLKEDAGAITVNVCGKNYSIPKTVFPTWKLLAMGGEPKQYTVGMIAEAKTETLKNIQLYPCGPNIKFQILENNDRRKTIRAEYQMAPEGKPKEIKKEVKLIVYYNFMNGVPAAAINGRLVSHCEKVSVRLFSATFGRGFDAYTPEGKPRVEYAKGGWAHIGGRYVTAEKNGEKLFFGPDLGCTPNKSFCATRANRWKIETLRKGESIDFPLLAGYVEKEGDAEKLHAFRKAVRIPPEGAKSNSALPDGALAAVPAPKKIEIGKFNSWDGIPLLVERNTLAHYRPAEANNWKGAKDLSFRAWSAFDKEHLYLRIHVTDDDVLQPTTGEGIWMGDCIQIAFDPLCAKTMTRDLILLGIAPGKSPNSCLWSHPDSKVKDRASGDLSTIVRSAVRRVADGYECELAFPWSFLKPFELKYGKMGFNIVVLDKNGSNWMGITDGIAGSKSPEKYENLYFRGYEKELFAKQEKPAPELTLSSPFVSIDVPFKVSAMVFVAEKNLPSELVFEFGDQIRRSQELSPGFQSFPYTFDGASLRPGPCKASVYLLKDGKKLYEKKYDLVLVNRAYLKSRAEQCARSVKELNRKLELIRKKGFDPVYLKSKSAIAGYFASRLIFLTDYDGKAKNADSLNKRYQRSYPRALENILYCERMVTAAAKEADAVLAGKSTLPSVPKRPVGVALTLKDGGFQFDGREVFLIGPNTWGIASAELTAYLADSGLNFINFFFNRNVHTEKAEVETIAESELRGVYANQRDCVSRKFDYDSVKTDTLAENKTLKRRGASPSLTYIVTHEEGHLFPLPAEKEKQFREYLKKKFGSVAELNRAVGGKYDSFDSITEKEILLSVPLKYESYLCWSEKLKPALKHANEVRRNYWKRPVSSHFSELMFKPYDVIGHVGDWDLHWESFDIAGLDAGVGVGVAKDFALDIGGRFLLLCDMARSFYPEKPVANNEQYLIPVSNMSIDVSEQYHYAASILPVLHGQNAASVFLFNPTFGSNYANTTFDRAEGFFQTARATLDMNRCPEEFAAFRTLKGPAAILYTVASYADRDYPDFIIDAYKGVYFSQFPCRFVSDRLVKNGKLKDYKILVVPNAKYVSDEVFSGIADFAANGGRVLFYGKDALSMDPYGRKVPARKKIIDTFTRLEKGEPRNYFDAYNKLLAELKISPEIQLAGTDGKVPFGVESRSVRRKDGSTLLYMINLNKEPVSVMLPRGSVWFDPVKGKEFSGRLELKSLDLYLLRKK